MDCREAAGLPLTRRPEGGVSVNIVSTARGDVMVMRAVQTCSEWLGGV